MGGKVSAILLPKNLVTVYLVVLTLRFGREGPIPWHMKSPDLNLLDYFLRVYMKVILYEILIVKQTFDLVARNQAICYVV